MRVPKVLSLRRSRKFRSKSDITFPSPPNTPHPLFAQLSIHPPEKVIKALYDYEAEAPDELSFRKGDFFHALTFDVEALWWEACNPITGVRGMVPVSYFQIIHKNETSPTFSSPMDTSNQSALLDTSSPSHTTTSDPPKLQPLYAIVLYDFQAERDDELEASAGDSIIVIAQSNEEWYVAKPIGKLGGPGLIPVSFVEIRDAVTGAPVIDVDDMLEKSGQKIPTVDEWKKTTADYNAAAIDLNTPNSIPHTPVNSVVPENDTQDNNHGPNNNDTSSTCYFSSQRHPTTDGSTTSSSYFSSQRQQPTTNGLNGLSPTSQNRSTTDSDEFKSMPVGIRITNASATGYELVDGQYVFRVTVELQLPDRIRTLIRRYDDFYELQITLLDAFPYESGRTQEQRRILPFMPGPLAFVNETITSQRCIDLDVYLKELLSLPPYMLMHPAIERFFNVQSDNGRDVEMLTPHPQRRPHTISRRHSSISLRRSDRSAYSSHAFSQQSILHPPQQLCSSPISSPPSSPPFSPIIHSSSCSDMHSNHGRKFGSSSAHLVDTAVVRAWAMQQFDTYSPSVAAAPEFPGTPLEQNQTDSETGSKSPKKPKTLKVKVIKGEDIIAIRVPTAVEFSELHNRIADRFDAKEDLVVAYKDRNGRYSRMRTDEDLKRAIEDGGGKLLLYAFD